MSKSARFFRVVWRVNAVLFLIVAIAAAFGVVWFVISQVRDTFRVREAEKAAPVVAVKGASDDLTLTGFTTVEGTSTLRANLTSIEPARKYSSSGGSGETRNMFYLDLDTSAAHWLLPNNDQVITYSDDVTHSVGKGETAPVGTVILAKPRSASSESSGGRLLMAGPTASVVKQIADGVTAVSSTSIIRSGDLAIVYQQDRTYHVATIDSGTLALRSVRPVIINSR